MKLSVTAFNEISRDNVSGCSIPAVREPTVGHKQSKEPRLENGHSRLDCEEFGSTEILSVGMQAVEKSCKPIGSLAWTNLNVFGFGSTTDYQRTFSNYPSMLMSYVSGSRRRSKTTILREFEGLVTGGQMLLVLGKPGSGCTTLLKTLAGHTHGLSIEQQSILNYQGMLVRVPPSLHSVLI